MMLNGNNYKFGDDGFTKVEKEIATYMQRMLKAGRKSKNIS